MYVTLWYFVQTFRRKAFTAALRLPGDAGPGPAAVPRLPPLRPDHLHRLRQVRRACPVDCIYIDKEKAPPPAKGFVVTGFTIDYTKCMFCALCVDPCPVDCIFMGSTYDLSCYTRDGCVVDFAKLPLEVAWGQATLNPTAVHESKKVTPAGLDQGGGHVRMNARASVATILGVRRRRGRVPARLERCSLGQLFRPDRPSPEKGEVYECGEPPIGVGVDPVRPAVLRGGAAVRGLRRGDRVLLPVGGGVRQANRAADANLPAEQRIEAAQADSAAAGDAGRPRRTPAAMDALARFAFVDLLVFFGVLLVGFAYLWRRGDLDWVRSVAAQVQAARQQPSPRRGRGWARRRSQHGFAGRTASKTGSSSPRSSRRSTGRASRACGR